jgi:MoxR-like ATPase
MVEGEVTVEGVTRQIPEPFFVVATQNPLEQYGTFPLPESQLDRFAMRISLGYPDVEAERDLLTGRSRREMLSGLSKAIEREALFVLFEKVKQVHVSSALLDYVQALLGHSRTSSKFSNGLSPRAGLALLSTARAWAHLEGRDMVLPEDVRAVLPGVVDHRMVSAKESSPSEILLAEVSIP